VWYYKCGIINCIQILRPNKAAWVFLLPQKGPRSVDMAAEVRGRFPDRSFIYLCHACHHPHVHTDPAAKTMEPVVESLLYTTLRRNSVKVSIGCGHEEKTCTKYTLLKEVFSKVL